MSLPSQDHAFSLPERQALYRTIHERRDMRHFSGGTVADELLQRLLSAAHHAPSVGFMPTLQAEKWARRASLADMVFEDLWGQPAEPLADA